MFLCMTAAALQLLSSSIPGSGKVYDILKSKHPAAAQIDSVAFLPDSAPTALVNSTIFDALDGSVIRAAALRTSGAAGPSGIDAYGWRRPFALLLTNFALLLPSLLVVCVLRMLTWQ